MSLRYPCPDCEGENFAPFYTCRDYLVSGELFALGKCRSCGMVVTLQPPSPEEMPKYYQSENYISHSDLQRGLFFKTYHFVRKVMLGAKRKLVIQATGKEKGNLLDWGCGTGYFLNAMQQAGWQVQGIEVSDQARAYAREKFGVPVVSPAEIVHLPSHHYHCVTFWHVLEHLHHLENTLAELKRLLAPGGIAVIALPNQQSYDAWYYGRYWAAWDVPRHLWHFAPPHIERLMNAAGFRLYHKQPLPFDSFYVALLSEKYRGKRLGVINAMVQGLISFLQGYYQVNRASSIVYLFG
ncbi:MAG: class I SAM-dependent methyltransferase [Cytophagales bacterium]|nr:class I SAM-dependent methyltransferase [Bernardetiaceae bacterium]MDW8210037.1 class I SAM-dependent methyltransferase [Cytophagales bacterium]